MKSIYAITEKSIKDCLNLAEQLKKVNEILEEIKKEVNDESNRYYDDDGEFCIINGKYLEYLLNKGDE